MTMLRGYAIHIEAFYVRKAAAQYAREMQHLGLRVARYTRELSAAGHHPVELIYTVVVRPKKAPTNKSSEWPLREIRRRTEDLRAHQTRRHPHEKT